MKIIAVNKTAGFEYFIEEKYEAGIVLEGNEIKSLRAGGVNMNDCFCTVRGSEVTVKNMHIALYDKSDAFSTKTPAATAGSSSTREKSPRSRGKSIGRAIPWCPSDCISRTRSSRWKWRFARANTPTTKSARSPNGTSRGRPTAPSKTRASDKGGPLCAAARSGIEYTACATNKTPDRKSGRGLFSGLPKI